MCALACVCVSCLDNETGGEGGVGGGAVSSDDMESALSVLFAGW